MHNKRDLKKQINAVCGKLAVECLAVSECGDKLLADNAKNIISSIILINSDYLSRMSHPEPGMKQSEYYGVLKESFVKSINEVIEQVNNLNRPPVI